MKLTNASLLLALLFFVLAGVSPAQETRGGIKGTVRDPQASSVVGAAVVVTNVDTNTSVRLTTNTTGYYEAPLLLPGSYQVSVEAAGFKRAIRSGLVLAVGAQLEISFALEIGALSESVSVSAEAPILDASSVSAGRVLDQRNLVDLPVMGNNPILLTMMTPGVMSTGQIAAVVQGYVNKTSDYYMPGAVGGNEWSIDGVPNNGSNRRVATTPAAEALGEFKVETSNFDASFGHSTGVNVSMMSRSGSNAFHGTANNQAWSQKFNAAPFFVKQTYYRKIATARAAGDNALADWLSSQRIQTGRPHGNNFSGTIGGPVIIPKVLNGRDRLFFFFAYSGVREPRLVDPSGMNATVPTMANRQGDFSQLLKVDAVRYQIYDPLSVRPDPARPTHYLRTPISGNTIPQSRMLNPIYDFYMKRLPKPNSDPLSPTLEPTNNYIGANPDNNFLNNYTNRIDYNYSDRHRFFLRWGWSNFLEDAEDWTFESERGLQSNNNYRQNKSGTVDWTYARSAATVLNVSAAANFFRESMAGLGVKKYKPSDVGFPASVAKYLDDKCAILSVCQMPRVSFSGYSSLGRSFGNWTNDGTLTAKVNLSHLMGAHTLRGGVDVRDHRHTATPTGSTSGTFSFSNTYTRKDDDGLTPAGSLGLSWAAFMMGFPTSMSIDTPDSSATSNRYAGWYGQDTWRVGKRLTLNLGLRFEWEGGPTERLNRMLGAFDPNAALLISSAAQTAYAAKPLTERPAADFTIKGGSTYAGVKGADRKLWRNELMWLPRLSAAWQFSDRMVLRGGYGVYFDTLNVLNEGINQLGFSRSTSTTVSTDFGYHWLVGNPANGIVPIMDPFPIRSDGTRFDAPYRDALGAMAVVGRGLSFAEYDRQHPRVQRWRVSVQRQLSPNMMVEAAYWGQWGDRIGISQKLDYLDGKYWATGLVRNNTIANDLNSNVTNPFYIGNFSSLQTSDPLVYQQMSTMSFFTSSTIRKNQLLRPYPHINGLTDTTTPIGKARTHVLEITFERRFSKGLSLNASYSRLQSDKWDVVENEFDRGPSRWYPTGNARPHRVTITGIYELPAGRNRAFWRSGVLRHVFGEWQVAGTYEWQPGYMLSWGNIFYYGDVNTFEQDVTNVTRTLDQWFNTGLAFEKTSGKTAAAYHVRVFPPRFSGVRSAPTSQLNGNIQRDFLIKERVTFQIRLDALNLPNYSLMEGPNTDPVSSNFGKVTSQTRNLNRFMQIQARIRF